MASIDTRRRFTGAVFCKQCHQERYQETENFFNQKCQARLEELCKEWGITVEEYYQRRTR